MDFNSFIGKTCRVISKQNVRYSGTLQVIDPVERKIRVTNVRCHGTEDRPAEMFMPAIQEPFGLVEFNVNDLKDLRFDEEDSTPVAASAQAAPPAQPAQPQYPTPQQPQQIPQQQRPPQQSVPPPSFSAEKALPPNFNVYQATAPVPPAAASVANVSPAAANTDSLNRAMGNMKLNGNNPARTNGTNAGPHPGRGGGRGRGRGRGTGNHHHQQHPRAEIKIPASDFDFEASNKLFDKGSTVQQYIQQQQPLYAGATFNSSPADKVTQTSPASAAVNAGKKDDDDAPVVKEKVYNPKTSFFDNISSDLAAKKPVAEKSGTAPEVQDDSGGGRGRGRGRGGPSYGRMRRDEEREKNVETFGEPGGVGLMGPGSYVGGYGGYRGRRRRGGARGGRGGAAGNAPRVAVNTN